MGETLSSYATFKCKGEDRVIQHGGDVIATEGETLTLACTFETTSNTSYDYIFWYRQYPGKPPEFLLTIIGTEKSEQILKSDSRISTKLSEDKRGVDLEISSAAVTDSALYYCAVKPTVTGNTQSLYKNLTSCWRPVSHILFHFPPPLEGDMTQQALLCCCPVGPFCH
uniref:Ig-like domain-containing protein n=1 Tax=Myripristis murdjan TaxID=586833 RepID=A0A667WQD1_9TELE